MRPSAIELRIYEALSPEVLMYETFSLELLMYEASAAKNVCGLNRWSYRKWRRKRS